MKVIYKILGSIIEAIDGLLTKLAYFFMFSMIIFNMYLMEQTFVREGIVVEGALQFAMQLSGVAVAYFFIKKLFELYGIYLINHNYTDSKEELEEE